MIAYQYEAVKLNNRQSEIGLIEAVSERSARELLREKDLITTKLQPLNEPNTNTRKESIFSENNNIFSFTSGSSQIIILESLLYLLQSGLTFNEALIYLQTRSSLLGHHYGNILHTIQQETASGSSLHKVFLRHTLFNDPVIINMVEAAEISQNFTSILECLVQVLKKRQAFSEKVLQAFISFSIVLLGLTTSLLFLTADIWENLISINPTEVITLFFNEMNSGFILLVLGCTAIFYFLATNIFTSVFKSVFNYYQLHTPVLRNILITFENIQWLSIFDMLMENKIPTITALQMALDSVDNVYVRLSYSSVIEGIKQGQRLSVALSKTDCLPEIAIGMIASAEARGELRPILKRLVTMLEFFTEQQLLWLERTKQTLMLITTILIVIVLFNH